MTAREIKSIREIESFLTQTGVQLTRPMIECMTHSWNRMV